MSDPGKEVLYDLYWNQGKSLSEISKIVGNPFQTVWYWMRKYNISCRSGSEAVDGKRNGFYGRTHTDASRKKISAVHKGKITWNRGLTKSDPRVMKYALALTGKEKTPEHRKKVSESKKGKSPNLSEDARKKMAERGRVKMLEYNKIRPPIGKNNPNWKGGNKIKKCLYCGKEYEVIPCFVNRSKYCSRQCHGKAWVHEARIRQHIRPNLVEKELISIIEKNKLPLKYVGDGSFWIAGKNPDFIHENDKKIAVEVFGEYWHSPILNPRLPKGRTYQERKNIFKKQGWIMIIFWEFELQTKNAEQLVLNRLEKFNIKPS